MSTTIKKVVAVGKLPLWSHRGHTTVHLPFRFSCSATHNGTSACMFGSKGPKSPCQAIATARRHRRRVTGAAGVVYASQQRHVHS